MTHFSSLFVALSDRAFPQVTDGKRVRNSLNLPDFFRLSLFLAHSNGFPMPRIKADVDHK